ncbi:RHS repeat-associated core domain-containing protein [Parvularcula lutaonensis]|uniref:RHS repeat-associated core domain-containing protein n=1 Tax=Parvularcula lutaonensis TaxID=491923 RepID=A0ABV7MI32_9PROT|nr:RHS repeat-associated core domain-containing protein [Parvularcula lutaonensis]GGY57285.1 hypothetical protein GCM10007148_28440 [Parvularcula lutaonensis]
MPAPFDAVLASVSRILSTSLLIAVGSFATSDAFAQRGGGGGSTVSGDAVPALKYIERQNVDERLTAHGLDLLGDRIDLNTGALTFEQVDISLPGNSDLPVELRRTIDQSEPYAHLDSFTVSASLTDDFSDWQLAIPKIEFIRIHDYGSWTPIPSTFNFCSAVPYGRVSMAFGDNTRSGSDIIEAWEWSDGVKMSVPGVGTETLLSQPTGVNWPAGTDRVSTGYWTYDCINRAGGGTGFLATSPDGIEYVFDVFAVRAEHALPVSFLWSGGAMQSDLGRVSAELYPSEIRNPSGAWVRYEYNSDKRVTRIHADDGREITIQRDGVGKITSASAHGRTWTYTYNTSISSKPRLSAVTLPDGRNWSFSLQGIGFQVAANCNQNQGDQTLTVTHPDGMTGTFVTRETRHLLGDNPLTSDLRPTQYCGQVPYYEHMSVISKTLSGSGYPSSTWSYSYAGHVDGQPAASLKWGQVIDPEGTRTREYFHTKTNLQGLISSRGVYSGSTQLQHTTFSHVVEAELGNSYMGNVNPATLEAPRHPVQRILSQGGETYTTGLTYETNQSSSSYSFGKPTLQNRSSTLQSGSQTTQTSYTNRLGHWILALPATIQEGGILVQSNIYDSFGRLTREDRYGSLFATFGYHTGTGQKGSMAWFKDALNRQVSLNNWKRGTPQSITRPDGVVLSRAVNNFGELTSQTDGRGTTITYGYDGAGRLTLINRPSGYADTTLTYTGLGSGLTQTITYGTKRTIVAYDAMLRPTLETKTVSSGGGAPVYHRFEYDALNRTVFTSFPSAAQSAPDGVNTTYDGLGRTVQVQETVAPFATVVTSYLSDNRVQVTDAEGNATTTWRSGWGDPHDGELVRIDDPLGLRTDMTYDVLGYLLSARQHGSHSGFTVDETQTWAYDSQRRICRHVTPQSGHTLYEYDAVGQMTGGERGANSGSGCASLNSSRRVLTSFDVLGRVDTINFPDASPDIDFDYDNNGNLTRAARGSAIWTYAYNTMNRKTAETLTIDGRTYTSSYSFTANDRLVGRFTPAGRGIDFGPNGHGQPTRARVSGTNYAGSGVYHASGQLASATYSNGLAYQATFNARQQMTSMQVAAGSSSRLRFSYGHDAVGRVTGITDHVVSGENRSYTYDALGRLLTAAGPWGSGSFTYDLLNNIRSKSLGSRTVTLEYNGSGRLARYRDTASGNVWRNQAYDARGNITNDGVHGFVYDRSEQVSVISGGASGTFVYDAHGRRVKQVLAGETIYSVYGLEGTLLFRDNVTTGKSTDYITMGSHKVGRFSETGAFTWTHADHLGSASAATDNLGFVTWRESYTPFGEVRNNPAGNQDETGFTGHVWDQATGLVYAQARFYNPVTARFLSSDSVGFMAAGPRYFNRYAYVKNDPVNATDPSGRCSVRGGAVSAASPGCRIVGIQGASSDPRYDESVTQIRRSSGLVRHSIFGGGAPAQFDISRHPRSISQAEGRILRSADGGDAGSFSRAIAEAQRTGSPQQISTTLGGLQTGVVGVGQATFTLEGTLTVNGNEWRFSGTITGTREEFDFNSKPAGERAAGSEAATRAAAASGASEYDVEYLGSFEIEAAGRISSASSGGCGVATRLGC